MQHTVDAVRAILTTDVVGAISATYGDRPVFPFETTIVEGGAPGSPFPGWTEDVLLMSHESQGVCAWGVSLGGADVGTVVVGGDLSGGRGTCVYVSSVRDFVDCRRWDGALFASEPLLQAQAAELDDRSLAFLRARFGEVASTSGWPCDANYRFQSGETRVMLWACTGQCDWWVSGHIDDLQELVPQLRELSNLRTALWSNDEAGADLLRRCGSA